MFASLVLLAIRHTVYREDGAAYGFYQIPRFGGMLVVAGFVLVSCAPTVGAVRKHSDADGQATEA
jgi:UDP-N-acetylmuramyl pentapeptide phosphotransferase/UDP-N-acetylglucosamine-1-phosphate transferase